MRIPSGVDAASEVGLLASASGALPSPSSGAPVPVVVRAQALAHATQAHETVAKRRTQAS
jgi:hypothetical protein